MIPYLKGIHLTIEHWRDDRDELGWPDQQAICTKKRRSDNKILADFDEQISLLAVLADLQEGSDLLEPPQKLLPVPWLRSDVLCLLELFKEETPAVRCVRGATYATVVYGCGDASGAGFGSAFVANANCGDGDKLDNSIAYRVGVWGSNSDDVSSNFCKLRNVVEGIKAEVEEGRLRNAELFMFTDNSTAEAAFYRGTLSNKELFKLVLRLKKLEMTAGIKIHLIHISG
jgi:hypothetical protein